MDTRLEKRIQQTDLVKLKRAFMLGDREGNKLCLNKEQFCRALGQKLKFGSREEYADLFEKIDVTRQGLIDWDNFSEHMLLGMYEKDKRVPLWRNLITLKSPHKHAIQRIAFLKTTRRYLVISKEGTISTWNTDLKLQRSLRTAIDTCKPRDLWVTYFVAMVNLNKAALSFTSKEIAIYDLSSKAEFSIQYKIHSLPYTPLCLDYRYNPDNSDEACLVFGDVGGYVHAITFNSALTALFERPPGPIAQDQDSILNIHLSDLSRNKYRTVGHTKYLAHDKMWVRRVKFSRYLECFISCATSSQRSIVIGWMEKRHTFSNQSAKSTIPLKKEILRYSVFSTHDGVNTFDYSKRLNLIATAGVNHNVCLWNPYVASRPNGVLQGHTASVLQVQFIRHRGQLISLAMNKVLRIWDIHLQTCIYQLAGKFPKTIDAFSALFFDEGKDRSGVERNRLFVSFNEKLMMMQMRPENKDKIMSHDNPVVAAVYNSAYNQVISICQGGTMINWMIETGQKVKQFTGCHGKSEITCLTQDPGQTRIFTGSTDGTVKIWDHNGICFHTLICAGGQTAEVGQIVILKRSVIVLGWSSTITLFRNEDIDRETRVEPSDWKGGQEHVDDILYGAFQPPYTLATASYDGEIIVWNTNSEASSRHITDRMNKRLTSSHHVTHNNQVDHTLSNSKLLFLETRKGNSSMGGANMVSCGGSGVVRFWNSNIGALIAEFAAHSGSITMATDKKNRYLVTGDVDGLIKVWEILDYAIRPVDKLIATEPTLKTRFQPHTDMINNIEVCDKSNNVLVITASADCSIALWDIDGVKVGVFGQDELWILDTYKTEAKDSKRVQFKAVESPDETNKTFVTSEVSEEDEPDDDSTTVDQVKEVKEDTDDHWEPDPRATKSPGTYRFDAWGTTVLGKGYQECRRSKRPRKQPGIIQGLAYLNRRKPSRTVIGLYSALEMRSLTEINMPTKPDPDEYFYDSETKELETKISKLPALADTLKTAFDERSLLPAYIREYEKRNRALHKEMNAPPKMGRKRPKTSLQNIGMQFGAQLQMGLQEGFVGAQPVRPKGARPKTTGSHSSRGSSK